MRQRLLHQRFNGFVVEDVAGVVDQAVLAMRGVRVQRLVAHHAQLGETRFQRADRARDDAVVVPGNAAIGGLGRGIGHAEQVDDGNAQFQRLFADLQQFVDRQPLDAGHRGHRCAAVLIVHEHRQDQVVRGQDVLAHQAPREPVAAHPPRARGGIAHAGILRRPAQGQKKTGATRAPVGGATAFTVDQGRSEQVVIAVCWAEVIKPAAFSFAAKPLMQDLRPVVVG